MSKYQENILLLKPKARSKTRILLGKKYYTYKRYLSWFLGNNKYSNEKVEEAFRYTCASHKTPLYRKLKDVDMWYQYNKVINLKLAIQKLNKVVVKPNETFSYWKLIGKPTKRKGYVDGMVLFSGGFKPGVGGGLCQLSNLIYWMTLHTPLTVIERYRHSYDIFPDSKRTQPFGSGATCVYNYRDLQIYNNTNDTYQLNLKITDNELIGEWKTNTKPYCTYEVYEKEHIITQEYWGDYFRHNIIYRKCIDQNGELLEDEYIAENHAIMMYQPFLSDGSN
ncbi:vancomycin resistance protein VanW [Natranaerovirga pectinivora]|uniref:Vancomycin resistance protein VanW n=1 Tax=Natranaerovirga pectinivora TaxID=682400 RepID=A0A4R3ML18_9FIRM|nr:VanW family protein [Natranaerovirga pectinivora]TCT15298.1 vancomycin resistance protein VanW [Natranaerovirga pectinivora]